MKKKMLVILGPTSTGKTDTGIFFAQKLGGEIISADSRQVYKFLDTGTGKLPGSFTSLKKGEGFWEIDGVKIWMYDVVFPSERFNLFEYLKKASEVAADLSSRNQLPIVVGGTGLYIRSLIEGLEGFGPQEDIKLREEAELLTVDEIRQEIEDKNPEALSGLNNSELNNKRRLIRLLEKISGNGKRGSFKGLSEQFDVLKIGLTAPKNILDKRIAERVKKRLAGGMLEEARGLISTKVLDSRRMEELGLEYRYQARYLKGEIKTLEELEEILSIKIRRFAKRQMTWFRKEKNVEWFDISKPEFLAELESRVYNWYNKQSLLSRKLENKLA
jgi:tRNA dimethylallyltransferase